ncbi:MAG: hypothetical protein HOP37_04630 [Cyclobacteriaceae bacterium]|nr:hypothetical protein [Cyclobacteriaceae bacterium]
MIDLDKLSKRYVWSNSLGLSRSLLALATVLTLLFNAPSELFTDGIPSCDAFGISIFCLLSENVLLAKIISLIILTIVIVGWRPRFTCVLHWWITYSFACSVSTIDGGDHINAILTALLLPICIADSRKWHWQINNPSIEDSSYLFATRSIVAQVAFIVIKVQVSFIYLHSAVAKVSVKEWIDGTALYYWFSHPVFGANEFVKPLLSFFITNEYLSTYLTWAVILFEFSLFAGVFMDERFKKYFLVFGILFHFFIFLIHGLFTFFLVMSGAIILYFAPTYNFQLSTIAIGKIQKTRNHAI